MVGSVAAPSRVAIEVTVNGVRYAAEVEPRLLLVHFLRENLGLTGTHVGCDTSQCGACTVYLNGDTIKSCTVLAVQADGGEVLTIEGLAKDGKLDRVQEGFWEMHGLQCGFCTPGMILSSHALLEKYPNPTEDEIRHGLEGNLCRCTGYQNIVRAVQHAAGQIGADGKPVAPSAPLEFVADGTPPEEPETVQDWGDELAGKSDE